MGDRQYGFINTSPVSDVTDIVAAYGITSRQIGSFTNLRIQSSTAGDCDITANPQIAPGIDGQWLILMGSDDTKTVTLEDGDGLELVNTASTLTSGDVLILQYIEADSVWRQVIYSGADAYISDDAYDESTWDGVTGIGASKNAIRDQFEAEPSATRTLTNKTLTTPKITTSINDVNGNEVIKTPATTDAVNEVTLTNSATGDGVGISATGDDTNIDLEINAKGTGEIVKNVYKWVVPISSTGTAVTTGDGKAVLLVPTELNGKDLVSVRQFVETAGTTGTQDVQIARIRSGSEVNMLSTESTLDSGDTSTDDATTPAVIDTDNDDLVTDDIIRVDIDAVHTTKAVGGWIELIFRK